jgi:archaellin
MKLIMKIKKYLLLGFITLTSVGCGVVYAAPTSLICIRENGTHNFPVEFDEITKTVQTNFGESPAEIDKTKIVFIATTKEGVSYSFIIYRATGRMELWNDGTKKQLTPYSCSLAKSKF